MNVIHQMEFFLYDGVNFDFPVVDGFECEFDFGGVILK